ncbi:MAG: GNAT family N-acetyltransferase [Aeromicrobium sp.]
MDPNDRELVDQWLATWRHVRGITSELVDGWPLVHVGTATRETELVCIDPGVEEFTSLMRHVAGDPRAMLTVVAHDVGPYLVTRRPADVRVDRDDETLMSTTFAEVPIPRLDAEFTFRWDVEDHRLVYTVESGDRIAAGGTVGVLGDVATFDAVETTPAFQRRGLGRHVMATLTVQAMGRGATSGVLAASAPGRQLYLSLGWDVRLEMLSLMGT